MTEARALAVLDAGIDRVNISIYSSTPEEHRAYTKTDFFEQAAERVKFFIRTARARKAKTLINVFFLPLEGINSYERYQEYWAPVPAADSGQPDPAPVRGVVAALDAGDAPDRPDRTDQVGS